jgi:formylglycine-generating enzyme required for sulfatase activity
VLWGAEPAAAVHQGAVLVAPGEMEMGTPVTEEGRFPSEVLHRVVLTRPFLLGATEVTQAQYQAVMGVNPSNFTACGPTCPVEKVSWNDAVAFCNRASEIEGLQRAYQIGPKGVVWHWDANGYRLPTEAEWEYAARAGRRERYSGSDNVDDVAWYEANSRGSTHPVGGKAPNHWGLYDMTGNVREWVWDIPISPPPTDKFTDPVGAATGTDRVSRGGSWSANDARVRAGYRRWAVPTDKANALGFRVARTLPPQ